MGTEIYLTVGGATVDWSKNRRGRDHGVLFQPDDRKPLRDEADEELTIEYAAEAPEFQYKRRLRTIVPRLDLLGHTPDSVKAEYAKVLDEWLSYQEDDQGEPPKRLAFEEFVAFIGRHPLPELDNSYAPGVDEASENKVRSRFTNDPVFCRIPTNEGSGDGYSEADYFGSLVRILHPYSVMRALAMVPANLDVEVAWDYGLLVGSGWCDEEEFAPFARRNQTYLIATEGTTDIRILKRALDVLMPEVTDFFRFIDVTDRHPFSGTGSLVNFAEGLASIDVHNQVVFLFDNDAEGWFAYEKVRCMRLPKNMHTLVLPDMPDFRQFRCVGPHGEMQGDINRRAASIECYLDLRLKNRPPAKVRWTNFREAQGVYQGSLEHKETYMRSFLRAKPDTIASGTYDVSKLRVVLNALFKECSSIAAAVRTLENELW